jgi:hypothetical protein
MDLAVDFLVDCCNEWALGITFEERVAHGYIGSTWSTFWQADSCPTNL